jgi:ubiquinone/menaquinone biosynthesis C-methylase UbiE
MTDFDDFKNFEREGWEERASTYGNWAVTSQIVPVAVKALNLSSDDRVLELASGPGYGTSEISKKTKNVLGTDFAQSMVFEAKNLFPDLNFKQADAENLKFEDNSFDKVFCTFGVLHFAHPAKAISEVQRVLKSGGIFVFTVWAPVEESPFFGILSEVISQLGSFDVGLPDAPPIDDFSDRERASVKLSEQGLEMIGFQAEDNVFDTGASPSKMPTVYREVGVRSKGLLDAQDPNKLPKIEAELVSRYREFEEEGTVKMPFPYRIVTAKKN